MEKWKNKTIDFWKHKRYNGSINKENIMNQNNYLTPEEYLETIKDQLGDIIELQKELIKAMKGEN